MQLNAGLSPVPAGGEGGSASADRQSLVVSLSIPADRDHVVIVRSVIGHIGARLGLGIDQITDLRLAVDEGCGLFLLPAGLGVAAESLQCTFEERPDALTVVISAKTGPVAAPDMEDLGWLILKSLVDAIEWTSVDDVTQLAFVKRLVR